MSEVPAPLPDLTLQTRTEHSRSLEDAEKFRALETLREVGLLIPLSEVDTFHGRLSSGDEEAEWNVDPTFTNGGNDSGNSNVNNRPTLYSTDKRTAQDFADARAGHDRAYWHHLVDKVRNYSDDENEGRLERQNAHLRKLWEEDVESGRVDPEKTSPTVWTMEQLLSSNSVVEARYLMESLGDEEYEKFKEQLKDKKRTEIHEIAVDDIDATVLDFSFDETKLDDEARAKYRQALRALAIPITDGSPVSWDARNSVSPFVESMQKAKKHYVLQREVAEIASDAGVDESVALQLASAFNTRQIALQKPSYLVSQLIKHSKDIVTDTLEVNGKSEELPLNLEYVQRYLRKAHIVGVKQSINSATLDRNITSVSFFDLEKVATTRSIEAERKRTWQSLGSVATSLGKMMRPEVEHQQPLLRLLEDVHAKPEKLVEATMTIDGYKEIMNGKAGNWEGFTLAEHTETVLHNFDESYADTLPVEMLGPMRLAILSHDLGKPVASARGEKHRQKEYNVNQAGDFFDKLGIDERLKGLLLAVIGDGEELAFQIDVRGAGESAETAMRQLAISTLQAFNGSEQVTNEQINGFEEMCRILQICDGGAYTSMAVTRKADGKGRHRNAPSFNSSFAQPVGFGKRTIRLRQDGDNPASTDQTPKAAEQQSRLRVSSRSAGRKPPTLIT